MKIKRNPNKPIDCLLLAKNDWANTGFRFWKCLLNLGLNAVMFKGEPHAFRYSQQAPLHPSLAGTPIKAHPVTVMAPGLETLIESAHVIQLGASTFPLVPLNWRNCNVVAVHGGTTFRLKPDACNYVFNQFVSATIIQCPDLLGLGAKNEHLIYYPVDTEKIQPNYARVDSRKILIGHFPSTPAVKGTATILKAIDSLKQQSDISDRFEYVGTTQTGESWTVRPWEENLKRLAQCDIIIETCNLLNHGKKFGEWGNTALEAAASGCVVVTNTLTPELYKEQYGDCALRIANDQEALEAVLRNLICLTDSALLEEKKKVRAWVEKHHSMDATAKRLWDKVYHQFF